MSLVVWLPMTKDLRQQGLSDVTVVNNGATFNSSGKLGGCYSFDGGDEIQSSTNLSITGDASYSISFWFYWDADSWSTDYVGVVGFGSMSTLGGAFACLPNGYPDLDFWNQRYKANSQLSVKTWYHLTFTKESGTKGLGHIYVNGVEVAGTSSNTTATPNIVAGKLLIGRLNATSTRYFKGKINDIRIYDHCLSPMEVKRISQGLILHYPLDNMGFGQENLFSYQNKGANVIVLNDYQNTGSFTQFYNCLTFDPSTTVGKKYTISLWARSPNGTTNFSLYNANTTPRYFYFSTTLTTSLGTEWQYFTYTFTNQDRGSGNVAYSNRIEIYASGKMKAEVKMIKIEEGEKATPWSPAPSDNLATQMGLNSNIEYDTSGYCNNLIKNGTYSYVSDTPKYEVSTTFSGTEYMNGATPSAEILTLSCWVKTSKNKSTSQFIIADSTSQMCISFYSGNIIGYYGPSGSQGTGSKCVLGTSYKENDWNHIVVVKTGIGTRTVYCNGVALTPTSNDYWTVTYDGLILGSRAVNGNLPFYGQLCDVRAYATALSADDVKSLYQNSAYIDSSGNVYGTIHEV